MKKADIAQVVSHEYRSAFIPAWLDDYGLDVYAFRVYARLKRRADNNGKSYESVRHMAEAVGMSERRMHKAFTELEERGLLKRQFREHQSTIYHLLQPALGGTASGAEGGAPRAGGTASPAGGTAPRADKGTPLKDLPLKVSTNKEKESSRSISKQQAQQLIDTYNEHRGSMKHIRLLSENRESKLRTLIKRYGFEDAKDMLIKATKERAAEGWYATKGYGLDELLKLDRVVQYAEAYDHQQTQHTPQPDVRLRANEKQWAYDDAAEEWLALTPAERETITIDELAARNEERMLNEKRNRHEKD